ncbi:MAG: hypothetical protein RIS69_1366 [Actinomycetota bacterium]|jgi:hypothetical protein
MRRRELFERTIGVAGLAALLAACGADPPDVGSSMQREPATTARLPIVELAVVELAFASPWRSLIDNEMIDFGISVMGIAPEAVDHARDALSDLPEGSSLIARDKFFAECCRNDSRAGDVVVVDGWMVPVTLAGLAGALSQFK